MPKMKTHRGAAKRFNLTKSGKVKRAKSNRNHFLRRKSAKTKRNLRKQPLVDSTNVKNMKKILP